MGHNHPDQPAIQGAQTEVAECAEVLRRSCSRAQTPAKAGLHGCEDELLPNVSKKARVQELPTDAGARTVSQSPLQELGRERENVFTTARGETLAVADRKALLEARSVFGGLLSELSSSFAATLDGWSRTTARNSVASDIGLAADVRVARPLPAQSAESLLIGPCAGGAGMAGVADSSSLPPASSQEAGAEQDCAFGLAQPLCVQPPDPLPQGNGESELEVLSLAPPFHFPKGLTLSALL